MCYLRNIKKIKNSTVQFLEFDFTLVIKSKILFVISI